MKIEHLALNVAEPVAMADWYAEHLSMKVMRSTEAPVYARFLADDGGAVMLEIYHNDKAPVPDYAAMDPLVLHLALISNDVDGDCKRLVDAGASVVSPPFDTAGGDRLAMLRDPWGFAMQLVDRAEPMI